MRWKVIKLYFSLLPVEIFENRSVDKGNSTGNDRGKTYVPRVENYESKIISNVKIWTGKIVTV